MSPRAQFNCITALFFIGACVSMWVLHENVNFWLGILGGTVCLWISRYARKTGWF